MPAGDEIPLQPDPAREVFAGPLFRVEVQDWGGRRRDVVRHPGAVAVLPILPDGRLVLVRQLREAVGERLLEVPAGVLDVDGEDPADAAVREVREETGLAVRRLRGLHPIHTSPGFVDEAIWLYVADAEGDPVGGVEEGIETVVLEPDRAIEMVRSGEIADAKTALLLLLAVGFDRPRVATPEADRR